MKIAEPEIRGTVSGCARSNRMTTSDDACPSCQILIYGRIAGPLGSDSSPIDGISCDDRLEENYKDGDDGGQFRRKASSNEAWKLAE